VAEGGSGEVGEHRGRARGRGGGTGWDQRWLAMRGPLAVEEAYGAGSLGRCSLGDLARGGLRTTHARRRRTGHEATAGAACGAVLGGSGTRGREGAWLESSWTTDGIGNGEESK
jgi:hypothetical protein